MNPQTIQIESPGFNSGATIPDEYTGGGRDISPPLSWSGVPAEAQDLVLICEDPDAPGRTPFTHWIVYNMHPYRNKLPAGAAGQTGDGVEYKQGRNSYHEIGYRGPNPPAGSPHHYHFKLFALDTKLKLPEGRTRAEVMAAMQGHIIGVADIVGIHRTQ